MRKAIQVLLIIAMVGCGLVMLEGLAVMIGGDTYEDVITIATLLNLEIEEAQSIVGIGYIVEGAISLIIAIFAYKHFMAAQCASDIKTSWKIITLIFVGLIEGILMFCIKDEHFPGYIPPQTVTENGDDYMTQFAKLKELYDMGAITEEEYKQLKNDLFDKYNF